MQQVLRTAMLLAAGALTLAGAGRALAQDAEEFVPGELLVGLDSELDRDTLIGQLERTRSNLRAGGEAPAALIPERNGEATLKLKVEFQTATQSRLRTNPSAELQLLEQVADQIKTSNPKVQYAHPNWIVRLDPESVAGDENVPTGGSGALLQGANLPNDPLFKLGLQWHYQAPPRGMNAMGVWQAGITGSSDIVVAVLDTGEVYTNEDVSGSPNMLKGYNFISRDLCTNEPQSRSPDATDYGDACPQKGRNAPSWHGTHVAGTVGGVNTNNGVGVAGVNWSVSVVPVRVLGPGGGTVEDIAAGILWASGNRVNGAPPISKRADIINMSLGARGRCTENTYGAVINAIQQARRAGTTVVVSAGNGAYLDPQGHVCRQTRENAQTCVHRQENAAGHRPAGCPGVISVSAHDSDGMLAPYSNFGNGVSVLAPGGNGRKKMTVQMNNQNKEVPLAVFSTLGTNYGWMQGTSQAAPHVAGAIALALTKHPEWRGKPDLIAQKLRQSLVPPPAGACPPDKPCANMLDALRFINQP
jgi:serine protease